MPGRPQNLHMFSKVNLKYSVLAQWGKHDTVFTCPSSITYKFYLPGATGQAPMSSIEKKLYAPTGISVPIEGVPLVMVIFLVRGFRSEQRFRASRHAIVADDTVPASDTVPAGYTVPRKVMITHVVGILRPGAHGRR